MSPKWFSEEVTGEELKALMRPTNRKAAGKWDYLGSREKHHCFSQELVGRKIYRVLQTEYPVIDSFPLTSVKSKWRAAKTLRGEPFDGDLEELLERFRVELPEDGR